MSVIKISLDEAYQATGFDDSQRVESARLFARRLPNGYVKKITWDKGFDVQEWHLEEERLRAWRE